MIYNEVVQNARFLICNEVVYWQSFIVNIMFIKITQIIKIPQFQIQQFTMKLDRQDQQPRNNYYPILDDNQGTSITSQNRKSLSDDERMAKLRQKHPQNVLHDDKPFTENSQKNQYPGLGMNGNSLVVGNQVVGSQNYAPNQNQTQSQKPEPIKVYHQQVQHICSFQESPQTRVLHVRTDKSDAIIYGQSIPCQRCGLEAVGPLRLQSGSTVFAWGTCLLFTTAMFCFIPCVTNDCKDTCIQCPRCGHRKAIVKASCCA